MNLLTQLMIYIHYWLPFFKNDNFKYIKTSQKVTFNFSSLFYNFLSHHFFSYYLFFFSNSHAQRNITSIIYIVYRILWFLLCNVLHSVGNMYWWTFLRGLFLLLFPKTISTVANESLIPYNLIKKVAYLFLVGKLLFIDLKLGTHTK